MVVRIFNHDVEKSLALPSGKVSFEFIDRISAFLIAVSPILQHYKGLYENAGFTVLIVAILFLLLRFFKNGGRIQVKAEIVPLILFEFYTFLMRNWSISRLLYVGFFVILFLLISDGYVNFSYIFRYALGICLIAVILLYAQYIAHYLLGYNLNLRPLNLLVSQDVIWVRHANSGGTSSLFRRAAFFLEPSHMFLYMFPVLAILLLSPGVNQKRIRISIILTSGLILSTSGFGIVASVLLWVVYFAFSRPEQNNKNPDSPTVKKTFPISLILAPILIILLVVILYFTIPFVQQSINRLLDSTAFDGRTRLARNYVNNISGIDVLIGRAGLTSEIDFNLPGFYATYVKWGIIGLILTYWYYVQGLFKLKNAYFWITLIICVISFFTAHTHGTFYMMYYVVYLSMGYAISQKGVIPA